MVDAKERCETYRRYEQHTSSSSFRLLANLVRRTPAQEHRSGLLERRSSPAALRTDLLSMYITRHPVPRALPASCADIICRSLVIGWGSPNGWQQLLCASIFFLCFSTCVAQEPCVPSTVFLLFSNSRKGQTHRSNATEGLASPNKPFSSYHDLHRSQNNTKKRHPCRDVRCLRSLPPFSAHV